MDMMVHGAQRAQGAPKNRFRLRYLDHEIPINTGIFLIGRSSECDLVLRALHVSRRHARLRVSDGGLLIEDLDSRIGVLVNGRPIVTLTLLAPGDVICIGSDAMTVVGELQSGRECLPTLPPGPVSELSLD